MKANVKKTLNQLSDSALKEIEQYCLERREEALTLAQFRWLKMGIRALANNPKLTTDDFYQWLVCFKRLYQLNSRFKTDTELDNYLDSEMDKIFGKDGYPEEFVQQFKEI